MSINKIVVIGAGVMGSGIAEQLANADFKVHLLDMIPKDSENRNILAKQAIVRIAHNLDKASELIMPGNLQDDLDVIKSADWIIEVIVEKIEFKQELYKKLESLCKPNAIISSNTSTIQLKQLIDGMNDKFKQNFLITHFFNPPRYMQLVEMVVSDFTKKEVLENISNFIDINLGKTPIRSNDTPGFIANRIGCYWLQIALNEAIEMGVLIEEADFLMGPPIGIPKTGVFGLYDLIGIDVMQLIIESLGQNLNKEDDFVESKKSFSLISNMIENGFIGRKGKGGFYRATKDKIGNKTKEAIDLKIGKYRAIKAVDNSLKNIQDVIKNSEYGLKVLSKTLSYALNLIMEVSDNLSDIDQAMKLGYNWKFGPFELVDKIGADYFRKILKEQNITIPSILFELGDRKFYQDGKYFDGKNYVPIKRSKDTLVLEDFKDKKTIFQNDSAIILDIGNEVAAIEITSKMAMLNHDVFNLILEFFAKYAKSFKAVIIASGQSNFSVGGNLEFMLEKVNLNDFLSLREYLKLGQQTMLQIKCSPIPVVAAVKGMALGGGCEILLHAQGVAAYAEASVGLVETKVGLVPGWGGCKEMIMKSDSRVERIEAFKNIILGNVLHGSSNLQKVFKFKNFQKVMNPNRVLYEAKQLALKISENYHVQEQYIANIENISWQEVIKELNISGYELEIASKLAEIFSLQELNENDLLEKEQEIFISLLKNESTLEKIKQILK